MSGFLRHNRKHVSVSQCNLYQNDIWLYILEQLIGDRGKVGCSAFRGTAAELGVTKGLMDLSLPLKDAQDIAVA